MILIYYPENKLSPRGGPSGYLFNLKQQIDKLKVDDIQFLPTVKVRKVAFLQKIVPTRIKQFRRAINAATLYKRKENPIVDLNDYSIIHFHSTEDLYKCRDSLESYHGKVVLTSHSPCCFKQEILNKLNPNDKKKLEKRLNSLEKIDTFSFTRADYIIFPCKESEEPYYNTWKIYEKVRKPAKYKYLPTGSRKCYSSQTRQEIRKKYKIPLDAFVISFAGRHNEIKGYDDLKFLGSRLLDNPNVYFLIAGREEPLKGLNHKRWIEIGWTNDPHSIISASDLFILPNKETYFDLVLLEVMSLGIPVILSNTGGNRFFKKFNTESLMLYNSIEDAELLIIEFMRKDISERIKLGKINEKIFDDNFTLEKFASDYVKLIHSLI